MEDQAIQPQKPQGDSHPHHYMVHPVEHQTARGRRLPTMLGAFSAKYGSLPLYTLRGVVSRSMFAVREVMALS